MAVITREGLVVHVDDGVPSNWNLTRFWRISTREQVRFAAALSQAMTIGLQFDAAIVAASHLVGPRLAHALRLAAKNVRAGYSPFDSLRLTDFRFGDPLIGAMEVGEERSCLMGELLAYACRTNVEVARRATRRSAEVRRFFTVLASQVEKHQLSPALIRDVIRQRSWSRGFAAALTRLADDLEGGALFAEAVEYPPKWFDGHFLKCLEACESRNQLTLALRLLAAPWPPEPI